jgi:nitrogen regulatory protein PII
MGLVTANIQPIELDEARSVPSASGAQASAVIEADGFGQHKQYPEIDRGTRRADAALLSPVAIKSAVRVHAEGTEKGAGQTY